MGTGDTRDMLLETADRFFTERCGRDVVNGVEKGAWPADVLEGHRGDGPAADRRARGQRRRRRHPGRHAGAAAAGRLARRAGAARRDRAWPTC